MKFWTTVKAGETEYQVTSWLRAETTKATRPWQANREVFVKLSKVGSETKVLVFDGTVVATMTEAEAKALLRTKRDLEGRPIPLAGSELAALERRYDRVMWS